jgi:hypothetical protein
MTDQQLEARIARVYRRLCRAAPCFQRAWWRLMVRLIKRRSPEQILRMERERALR